MTAESEEGRRAARGARGGGLPAATWRVVARPRPAEQGIVTGIGATDLGYDPRP
jgi:hypothetical protein